MVTDQRLIAKEGVLNKSEFAIPLHFVQDASVRRSWLGIGRVEVSTAGGSQGNLTLDPLKADDARRLADTILREAKRFLGSRPQTPGARDHVTENLERLAALRETGALSEDEFAQQKARLLESGA